MSNFEISKNCLIVEDDENAASALGRVVESMGFSVARAESLLQARQLLAEKIPDLVLLDLSLPDGDGLEFMLEMRDLKRTRFVVITGNTTQQAAVESLRAEADDFLVKPVALSQLRDTITKATNRLENDLTGKTEVPADVEIGDKAAVDALVGKTFWRLEKDILFATLDRMGGDKAETARVLGISLKTLYNRLHAYS